MNSIKLQKEILTWKGRKNKSRDYRKFIYAVDGDLLWVIKNGHVAFLVDKENWFLGENILSTINWPEHLGSCDSLGHITDEIKDSDDGTKRKFRKFRLSNNNFVWIDEKYFNEFKDEYRTIYGSDGTHPLWFYGFNGRLLGFVLPVKM